MKAIIDCNSFYCSCERLFKPHLDDKPVVVLSNNDGCIVSRTDEAKKLGVKMAGPYFQAKPFIEQYNVATFSSNYHLYGDMSWRVMETLRMMLGAERVEVYSVDEAFLDMDDGSDEELYAAALHIRTTVEQWTGIKVSVGVAPTKVLSKIANHLAKKNKIETACVVVLQQKDSIQKALADTPVGEVWGVGRKYAEKLQEMNAVFTALDLSFMSEAWASKNLGGVVGVRLIKELNGKQGTVYEEALTTKKMIATTRMFGKAATTLTEIREAIATYTCRAAEKLRRQHGAAGRISIFVVTKGEDTRPGERFRHGPSYGASATLPLATSTTQDLIKAAMKLAEEIFCQGKIYKKAGVMLSEIVSDENIQGNLFSIEEKPNQRLLMNTIDNVNFAMRDDMLKFASSGTKRNWKMRAELRSQRHTTRWEELFEVR